MSNQSPSDTAREAKERQATLKELLKTKEPFDKEIDFPRKDLRKRYLNLLFVHPYAKESKDVETHLWMQTSYAFISEYKQRITRLDHIIQQQQQQQNQPKHGPHGPVEYRKLLQRFRQFLADEERFWTQFVVQLQKTFVLEEAKPILAALGIVVDDAEFVPEAEGPRRIRNNFFPQSDPMVSLVPTTPEQRESRIAILGKALVYLGDIARYRELYNEAGGRPRAGHEDAPPSGGKRSRNRRGGGGFDMPRPRNYEKAKLCYEQAKLLVPHEGNPSHQLAILANYSKDPFLAIVHYYRALCLRQRFDAALDNLNTTLQKELKVQVNKKKEGVTVPHDIAHVPKVRIDQFKDKVVLLHALWKLAREKNDENTIQLAHEIFRDFHVLASQRHLPEDFIVNVVVAAQGALWTQRMLRQSPSHRKARSSGNNSAIPSTSDILPSPVIESRIFTHLLSLYHALLAVGIDALRDPPPISMDAGKGEDGALAQRIAVELKRTLPALRIASKWLRANFKYVMSDPEAAGNDPDSDDNDDGKEKSKSKVSISSASTCTIDFWEQYAEFLRALSRIFPLDHLPTSIFPLKEDTELRGWSPLKDMLEERFDSSDTTEDVTEDVPHGESEVHPNVVQLMRIKDLLDDGKAIVGLENSPLALYGNRFVLKGVESAHQPIPTIPRNHDSVNAVGGRPRFASKDNRHAKKGAQKQPSTSRTVPVPPVLDDEDVMTEITSKTDDDPVREAFEHLDYSEDEIVWNPKASPVTSPVLPSPIAPPKSLTTSQQARSPIHAAFIPSSSPIVPLSMSPARSSALLPPKQSPPETSIRVAATTAEDLLKGFMLPNTSRAMGGIDQPRSVRKTSDPLPPPASAPTSAFLFGADRAGSNIWSASQDELGFSPSATGLITTSQDLSQSQSIWGSYPTSSQMSQHQLPGSLPSTNFAAPPLPISTDAFTGNPQHRRVPSASVAAQLFPSRNAQNAGGLVGQFGYASPLIPTPQLETFNRMEDPNVFNTPYANMSLHPQQQSLHGNFYDSGMSLGSSGQGLSPHMQPESRVNPPFMSSAQWGRVG
ncbi:hypothetical protein VKT23_015177 [Stygiomarasmius scandens]|uniref:Protein SMG7 n=1 Tax=Marasmiellus scandens TaxID=2682957 RepID=A0ABR1IYA8_9AGAR